MKEKKEIIKDTFRLTAARYVSQFLGFFTSIAMRRFLGPFYTGIWSLLSLIGDYTYYFLLGINEGVCYSIPILAGQKKESEIEEVKNVTFNFVFVVSCLTSIGVAIAAFIVRNRYPIEVVIGLFALSLYIFVDRICTYYMNLLRARKNFAVLSSAIVFDAAINLCLIMLLVKNFKIYGLYAAVVILSILNTMFIHTFVRYKINLGFRLAGIGKLMKIGFPLAVLGFLQRILSSLDTIMIAKMIGITFVGYYSVSIMAKNYMDQLSSFGTVLYPRLLEAFGRNGRVEDIKKYAIIPPKINAYILPLLLGWIFFVAPVLVKAILPKFIPGILAIQILLIDMFFRSCSPQFMHFLIALKKQSKVIFVTVLSIFLTVILNYFFIKAGYGIYGIAFATSLVSFFGFVSLQVYAMRHFAGAKEMLLFFLEIIAPFLYTAIIVLLMEKFIKLPNMYIALMVKCVALLIFSSPLLIYINRLTGIVNILIGILTDRISTKRGRK